MATTIAAVRTTLGEIDADELPDSVIQQAIDDTTLIVDERIEQSEQEDIAPELREYLIRVAAAKRAWNATPTETRRSALDLTTEWNIDSYTDELQRRVEDAFALLGETEGGTSAGFSMTTRGVFHDT